MRSQAEAWLSERLAPGSGLPYPGQERHRIIAQLADLTQVASLHFAAPWDLERGSS